MKDTDMFNKCRSSLKKIAIYLIPAAFLCMIILAGCGEDDSGGESGPVGSASVTWSMECPEDEPLAFIAQVYDASNTYLTYGGPWNCAAGTGTVNGIRTGQGRKIVLFAEDQTGAFVYRGEKTDIDIQEAVITDAGEITTYPFVVNLGEPYYQASSQDSVTLILSWDYAPGAARYIIEIADSTDFSFPVVSKSVPGPPYYAKPEDMPSGENYYWRVRCIDRFDAEVQGAWSQTLSFHPAPLISITSPEAGRTYDQFADIFLIGSAMDAIDGRPLLGEPQWYLVNGDAEDTPLCGYSGCEFSSVSIGTYTLELTATSQAGYVGSNSVTIYISPPE